MYNANHHTLTESSRKMLAFSRTNQPCVDNNKTKPRFLLSHDHWWPMRTTKFTFFTNYHIRFFSVYNYTFTKSIKFRDTDSKVFTANSSC